MPKVLDAKTIQSVAADIKAGLDKDAICKRNDIASSTYYRLPKRLRKGLGLQADGQSATPNGHTSPSRVEFMKIIENRLQRDKEFLSGVVHLLLK